MIKIRAMFFDFDYTLADASGGIVIGMQEAARAMGLPVPDAAGICRGIGGTLRQIYDGATGRTMTDEEYREFARLYLEKSEPHIVPETRFFADIPESLRRLSREDGIILCVVTNKHARYVEESMERDGLFKYLTRAIGHESMPAPKPDPRGPLALAAELGLRPEEVLFVGDSHYDRETAQNAGMPFGAVCTGTTGRQDFDPETAAFVADSMGELVELLEKCSFAV